MLLKAFLESGMYKQQPQVTYKRRDWAIYERVSTANVLQALFDLQAPGSTNSALPSAYCKLRQPYFNCGFGRLGGGYGVQPTTQTGQLYIF